jgi:hypothetical protein
MAASRTLKLSLLADVAGLSKGLTQGSNEVQGFGGKVADFGKESRRSFRGRRSSRYRFRR